MQVVAFIFVLSTTQKTPDYHCHVYLYQTCLQVKGFKDYIDLYLKDKTDETGAPIKMVHEVVNDRWEVAVAMSEKGFQQVSFVNSIATTKVNLKTI